MPIEIKELVIKVTVQEMKKGAGSASGQSGGGSENKQQIVQECVEQVMELLQAKSYDR